MTNQKKASDTVSVIKMGELTLLDAMLFQEVITRNNPVIPTLATSLSKQPRKNSFAQAWEQILEIDYQPIFKIALDLINVIPSSPAVEDALNILGVEAQKIASSRALLRHDLMGRVYHLLLMRDIAKYHATYYTSVPAAYLLSRFALNAPNDSWNLDWSKIDSIAGFKVGDLACGSGTLLSATYSAILDKHVTNSAFQELEAKPKELHEALIEKVMLGFDVLSFAAHLTAVTLALHNPSALFSTTGIYALDLTAGGGQPKLGSIDLLESTQMTPTVALTGEVIAAPEKKGIMTTEQGVVTVDKLDLIIMNPPFTRSVGGNLLFGALPKSERTQLQKALAQLLKKRGYSGIGQAGLGAVFVTVADRCLKKGGRMAFVVPRSLLSGVSWKKVRELLADNYHVELIITSHQAPDNWNFSENTDLSEILFVARKHTGKEDEPPIKTIIANLWQKPANEMESIVVSGKLVELNKTLLSQSTAYDMLENANAASFPLLIGDRQIGDAYSVNPQTLADTTDTWGQLAPFAQSPLNRMAYLLVKSGRCVNPQLSFPVKPLSELAENIGPDRSQIHGCFTISKVPTQFKALWEHDSKYITKLTVDSNTFLAPKANCAKQAENLWQKGKARLMLAERIWLITNRLMALHLSAEVIGNVWWPVRLKDVKADIKNTFISAEQNERLQTIWLNSTFGLLGILSLRQDTRGAWVGLKKDTWGHVPLLDISKLENNQVQALMGLFSTLCGKEPPAIPIQINHAAKKQGWRYELDQKLIEIVTGESKDLTAIYEMLAREPIISLKPLG